MDRIIFHIDTIIRFFLYLLIFWLPYSHAAIESAVGVSFVLWIIKRILLFRMTRRWNVFLPDPTGLNRFIYVFLFIAFLSAVGSAFFVQSVSGFTTKTLEWFVIFFLAAEVFKTRKQLYIFLGVWLFSAVASGLDGLVQFHWTHRDIFNGHVIEPGGRATAGFNDPNNFGGYLAPIIPLLWALMTDQKTNARRIFFAVILVVIAWALVVTFSRGAWLGALGGMIFLVWLWRGKWARRMIAAGIIVLILVSLMPAPWRSPIRLDMDNLQGTSSWRMGIWKDSLSMIADRPLFGHGPNMYMRVFREYRTKYQDRFEYDPAYAHNCYVQMAAEIGVFGLLAFLVLMFRFFRHMMRGIASSKESTAVTAGLLAGCVAFLIHSFLDTNFYSLQLSAYFWVMVGVLISLDKLLKSPVAHDIRVHM